MKRALLAAAALAACHASPDPERVKLVHRLQDARPAARIVAIQQLAPHANREETAAIARAAQDATSDVRKVVAMALAKVDSDTAIDLAAALLRDPSDDVRSEAVRTLAHRGGPRAVSYLAHAYADGGPLARAAIAATGTSIFAQAVQVEASRLTEDRLRRARDSHDMIRAEALVDIGSHAMPGDIPELSVRLADGSVAMAVAACRGLAEAGAREQLPEIVRALRGGRAEVAEACAEAIVTLDPSGAAETLSAALLPGRDAATMSALIDVLSGLTLSKGAFDAVCRVARESPDGVLAAHAASVVGRRCAVAGSEHPEAWKHTDVLRVWAALGHADDGLIRQAREESAGSDASLAAAAATYLGSVGTPADGESLVNVANREILALDAARTKITAAAEQRRARTTERREANEKRWRKVLGDKYDQMAKLRPPLREKILQRLGKSLGPDVADDFEPHAGAIDLISACAAGATLAEAKVDDLTRSLLSEKPIRLRLLAVEMANAIGKDGEPAQALARADPDPEIQRAQALHDLERKDESAIERLAPIVAPSSIEDRVEIAQALAPLAAKAEKLLIALTQSEDEAASAAVMTLGSVEGAAVDEALVSRLEDQRGFGAASAIEVLRDRQGDGIDAALARAAVHPRAEIREAALRALVSRHACGQAPGLAPLKDDYVGAVRSAAIALAAACKTAEHP